eukprot:7369666-Prorocentrum_lima.AAC.1
MPRFHQNTDAPVCTAKRLSLLHVPGEHEEPFQDAVWHPLEEADSLLGLPVKLAETFVEFET